MKKILPVLSVGILGVTWLACNCSKSTATASTPEQAAISSTKRITINESFVQDKYSADKLGTAVRIDSITVKGDLLSMKINYSGGCAMHSFDLISNLQFTKSIPPKTTLFLKHNDGGDACRKRIRETISYNISSIRFEGHSEVDFQLYNDKRWTTYNYD